MTLNSFTSVSLEPLLVLVSLAHGSRTLEKATASQRFAVNILHRRQQDVALDFAKRGAEFPRRTTRCRTASATSPCGTRSRCCAAR